MSKLLKEQWAKRATRENQRDTCMHIDIRTDIYYTCKQRNGNENMMCLYRYIYIYISNE